MFTASVRRLAALGCAGLLTCSALAGTISNNVYTITASNSNGTASYTAVLGDGSFNQNGEFTWTSPGKVDLFSPAFQYVASFEGSVFVRPNINAPAPFQISYSFNVDTPNVDGTTTFTITPANLSSASAVSPTALASVSMGVTDNNGDGATLLGLYNEPGAYIAHVNGVAPGGSQFAKLLSKVQAGPGGSGSGSGNTGGFQPVGQNTFAMSSQMLFSLTSGDSASGNSNFVLIPEPSSIALLVLGALGLVRRR